MTYNSDNENNSSNKKKYAQLLVPDYDLDTTGEQSSYLVLGVAPGASSTASKWAKFGNQTNDKAVGVREHTDGSRLVTTNQARTELVGGTYQIHVRDSSVDPTLNPTDDKTYIRLGQKTTDAVYQPTWFTGAKASTDITHDLAAIQSTAGANTVPFTWEDHTTGDRLTTTGGNKIEVIRGNYYLYVLREGDSAPQHAINYQQDSATEYFGGSWATLFEGPKMKQVVGNRTSSSLKPDVIQRSYVKTQKTEVWAGSTLSPDAADDTAPADGTISQTYHATKIVNTNEASTVSNYNGTVDSKVDLLEAFDYAIARTDDLNYVSATEFKKMGVYAALRLSGVQVDVEFSGLRSEVKASLLGYLEIEGSAMYTELFLGVKAEFAVAKKLEWSKTKYTSGVSTITATTKSEKVAAVFKRIGFAFKAVSAKTELGLAPVGP